MGLFWASALVCAALVVSIIIVFCRQTRKLRAIIKEACTSQRLTVHSHTLTLISLKLKCHPFGLFYRYRFTCEDAGYHFTGYIDTHRGNIILDVPHCTHPEENHQNTPHPFSGLKPANDAAKIIELPKR